MQMGNELYLMDADICLDILEENSIQTIYIDPPYNTGSKTFEYFDNHNNWNEFISIKLEKSKKILKETGFIFISIDDNKMVDLRIIGDRIFGKGNFLGMFITRQATRSNAKHINTIHEYVVVYAKNAKKAPKFELKRLDIPYYSEKIRSLIKDVTECFKKSNAETANKLLKNLLKTYENDEMFYWLRNYSIVDEDGNICFAKDLSTPGEPKELNIPEINLYLPKLKTRSWSSKEKIIELHSKNKLLYKNGRPYEKHLLSDSKDSAMSILNFYSRQGKHDLEKIGMGDLFSTAKPVDMIKYFIKLSSKEDGDIILDFFAGSGTTAQAVVECNKEDGIKRSFVLCQIKEEIKENKKAISHFKQLNRFPDVSEITRLRLEYLKNKYGIDYAEIID